MKKVDSYALTAKPGTRMSDGTKDYGSYVWLAAGIPYNNITNVDIVEVREMWFADDGKELKNGDEYAKAVWVKEGEVWEEVPERTDEEKGILPPEEPKEEAGV